MSLQDWLLDPSGLTPHGFCLSWSPGLIWLHAGSDAVIGLSYLSIPLAIATFAKRRSDFRYNTVAYLFIGFIVACGFTHLLAILTLWAPAYGIEGLVKFLTAGLSVATAVMLWPLIPRLLAIPSSDELARLNAELEKRVEGRTIELARSNAGLEALLSEKVRVEEALRVSEEQFRVSFEAAAVGKAQTDPATGRIVRVNPALARMLGYRPEELVGRAGDSLSHPDDAASDDPEFRRLITGEQSVYVTEKRYLKRDGEAVWGRLSASLVRSADNAEPLLLISVIENIGERKRAEENLRVAFDDREVALRSLTSALFQRDLLIREVYHRVKNNLQIVDSLLILQARELADPTSKDAIGGLRGRIFALGLVHQQLMQSTDLETFSVGPFLDELVSNLRASGLPPGVDLVVRADPLHVGLDFGIPLGLLVTELVTNSLKHAFPNGLPGSVQVSLERRADGDVLLSVADDGVGRADGGERSAARSPSMGSRIVAGLTEQMGGVMSVLQDNGTRVEIQFSEIGRS